MALEEKISFFSREDANEFQKYLRENGCSSRISVDYEYSGVPYFEGTITAFINFADMLCKKEEDADIETLKQNLIERKNILDDFLKSHKAGDVITESTPSQILALAQSIDSVGSAIEKEAAGKFEQTLMILATLEDNGLLEEINESDGYILKNVKDAGDLTVMYPYTDISGVTSEDLENSEITSHIITSSETKFIVTVGAEILFSSDMDDMVDLLDEMDTYEDESARFIDNIFFKKVLVSKIQESVESGAKSEADILSILDSPSFKLTDTEDTISFDISAEFLSEVISDLKKQGFLSGKDGKIKSN
ncbi:MAG: hypothetical protein Q4Q53_02115 [Methanocorpusculum sp.]|nr:hypothetical protein [Methanocorpusculum sp.]